MEDFGGHGEDEELFRGFVAPVKSGGGGRADRGAGRAAVRGIQDLARVTQGGTGAKTSTGTGSGSGRLSLPANTIIKPGQAIRIKPGGHRSAWTGGRK